jgi:hypothetical protein
MAHVYAQRGVPADEHAGPARVVEVDVREHEVPEVVHGETVLRERSLQRLEARARPTVDERGLVLCQQVRGDDTRSPEMEKVEKLETLAS